METPIQLLPLNCIRCGTPIPAAPDEVAWACENCGQGQQLQADGLHPLEIHYAQGIPASRKGRPFWVCEGRVTLKRDTYGRGKARGESARFWYAPRKFVIPAFDYPLEDFTRDGVRWLSAPPEMEPGPAVPFEPVTVPTEDVQPWAEFLIVAVEAGFKDKIKNLTFNLQLSPPQLWILP